MIRYQSPFNGKRYLLNTNTGEIHDLMRETPSCQIDNIKPEHIHMADSYEEAAIYVNICLDSFRLNGCHYCNPSKDMG